MKIRPQAGASPWAPERRQRERFGTQTTATILSHLQVAKSLCVDLGNTPTEPDPSCYRFQCIARRPSSVAMACGGSEVTS